MYLLLLSAHLFLLLDLSHSLYTHLDHIDKLLIWAGHRQTPMPEANVVPIEGQIPLHLKMPATSLSTNISPCPDQESHGWSVSSCA